MILRLYHLWSPEHLTGTTVYTSRFLLMIQSAARRKSKGHGHGHQSDASGHGKRFCEAAVVHYSTWWVVVHLLYDGDELSEAVKGLLKVYECDCKEMSSILVTAPWFFFSCLLISQLSSAPFFLSKEVWAVTQVFFLGKFYKVSFSPVFWYFLFFPDLPKQTVFPRSKTLTRSQQSRESAEEKAASQSQSSLQQMFNEMLMFNSNHLKSHLKFFIHIYLTCFPWLIYLLKYNFHVR